MGIILDVCKRKKATEDFHFQQVLIAEKLKEIGLARLLGVTDCSICHENVDHEIIFDLECKHVFHTLCLGQWMFRNNTCPLCRNKILEEKTLVL